MMITDNSHPLEDTVHILETLEELLHDVRLVEVSPEGDENLLVEQDELPQLSHLALDVPHQSLVEEFYPVRSCGSSDVTNRELMRVLYQAVLPEISARWGQ